MRGQVGPADGTATMLTFQVVFGLCLLILLPIVCEGNVDALEIRGSKCHVR